MAFPYSDESVDHEAEAAKQAEIASQVVEESTASESDVAGTAATAPEEDTVKVRLVSGAEVDGQKVVSLNVAGVELSEDEPEKDVPASVARLVAESPYAEVVE